MAETVVEEVVDVPVAKTGVRQTRTTRSANAKPVPPAPVTPEKKRLTSRKGAAPIIETVVEPVVTEKPEESVVTQGRRGRQTKVEKEIHVEKTPSVPEVKKTREPRSKKQKGQEKEAPVIEVPKEALVPPAESTEVIKPSEMKRSSRTQLKRDAKEPEAKVNSREARGTRRKKTETEASPAEKPLDDPETISTKSSKSQPEAEENGAEDEEGVATGAERELVKGLKEPFQKPLENVFSVLDSRKYGKLTKSQEVDIRKNLMVLMESIKTHVDADGPVPSEIIEKVVTPQEKEDELLTPEKTNDDVKGDTTDDHDFEVVSDAQPMDQDQQETGAGKKRKHSGEEKKMIQEEQPPKKVKTVQKLKVITLPKSCGRLMTCGSDSAGELGLRSLGVQKRRPCLVEDIKEPVALVAAGAMHTVAVSADGSKIYTFGCNDELALGRKTLVSNGDSRKSKETSADPDETEIVQNEDEDVPEAIPAPFELPNRIVKVTAGDSHTAALTIHGALFIWGCFRVCISCCFTPNNSTFCVIL